MSYHYLFRLVFIGDMHVGKSSICHYLMNDKINYYMQPTIGVEYGSQYFAVDENIIKCQIWDTSGDSSFIRITESYIKDNVGIILVFDKSNKQSFTNITRWVDLIKDKNIKVLLIGNKSDKSDVKVTNMEAHMFAENHGFYYIETSAKTGRNINKGFSQFIRDIYHTTPNLDAHPGIKKGVIFEDIELEKQRKCCGFSCFW